MTAVRTGAVPSPTVAATACRTAFTDFAELEAGLECSAAVRVCRDDGGVTLAANAYQLGKQIAEVSEQLGAAKEHRSGLISRHNLLTDLEARREGVSKFVAHGFDDDLNPDDGTPVNTGAGPVMELTPVGDALDVQRHFNLNEPTPFTYLPQLQTNLSNEKHGDQVAGSFDPRRAACGCREPVAVS